MFEIFCKNFGLIWKCLMMEKEEKNFLEYAVLKFSPHPRQIPNQSFPKSCPVSITMSPILRGTILVLKESELLFACLLHQAILYIVSDMVLNRAFPLVHFYQRFLYCFNGMGMEYSLRRQLCVSSCGWVNRMLDWESNGLGSFPEGVIFGNFFLFFFKLAPKNRSVKVSLVTFFSKLP